jgi:hypothetical protein
LQKVPRQQHVGAVLLATCAGKRQVRLEDLRILTVDHQQLDPGIVVHEQGGVAAINITHDR